MILANVIFVLINLCALSHAVSKCSPGSYYDGNKCSFCPPGTFRERFSRTNDRCTPCPPGTFTPLYGVGVEDLCWKCPPNYYSEINATSCTPCPSGLVSARGSESCVACGVGTYPTFNLKSGRVPVCTKCRPGFYKDNVKDFICTQCPPGRTSKKGSTSVSNCYKCPAGTRLTDFYVEGFVACQPCYEGSFSSYAGAESCSNCPPGFIASKIGATKCDPCPIGTKSSRYGGKKCWACPNGSTTYSVGQSVCKKIGKSCPKNTVEGPTGDCLKCDEGYYLSDSFKCTECPFGTRGLGGKARSCIKCPDRQYSLLGFGPCRCPGGEYVSSTGSCSKCPRGTDLRADLYDGKICNGCGVKQIAPKPGTSSCQRCQGYLVANEKRTKCVECKPGFAIDDPFTEIPYDNVYLRYGYGQCLNITTGCPPGFIRRGSYSSECYVQYCAVGTPSEEIGNTCLPCEKGYALLKEGKGCRQCPDGYVSNGGVITKCRKCPNGLLTDYGDRSKCSCTRSGYGIQDGTCAKCPSGYFAGYGESSCTACNPGEVAPMEGQYECWKCRDYTFKADAGPGECKQCPDGFIGNRKLGADKCVKKRMF